MARVRRAILGLITVSSLGAGATMLWTWVDPPALAGARTIDLLALLGLFVLPAGTHATMTADRRANTRQARAVGVSFSANAAMFSSADSVEPMGEGAASSADFEGRVEQWAPAAPSRRREPRFTHRPTVATTRDRPDGTPQPSKRGWTTR